MLRILVFGLIVIEALLAVPTRRSGSTDGPMFVPGEPWIVDSLTGNGNGVWDPGEQIQFFLFIKNAGSSSATDVSCDITTGDPYVTVEQNHSLFGNIDPGDSMRNFSAFLASSQTGTPHNHAVDFSMAIVCLETAMVTSCTLRIGRLTSVDPIPDGPRTPALYWAYDDNDSGWTQRPIYDWVEIKDVGTRLDFAFNDQVHALPLPAWFGALHYYGTSYDSISVSADGWIACGCDTTADYSNTRLPDTLGRPAMIALNWDDLYPFNADSASGGVYVFADSENHRLIVEYDSVAYYQPREVRDKFEAIVADSTQLSPSGDNVFLVQYMTGSRDSSITIGLQDPTRTIGIQYLFNQVYHPQAQPKAPGRAIAYVAGPATALRSEDLRRRIAGGQLQISPNPSHGRFAINWSGSPGQRAELLVLDACGRVIRRLDARRGHRIFWDAQDCRGQAATPGIYFLKIRAGQGSFTGKAILMP